MRMELLRGVHALLTLVRTRKMGTISQARCHSSPPPAVPIMAIIAISPTPISLKKTIVCTRPVQVPQAF